MHERFRWPTDKVLLLSMGVVAAPGPTKENPITDAVTEAMPMLKEPAAGRRVAVRRDAGVIAPRAAPGLPVRTARLPQQSFQGRY